MFVIQINSDLEDTYEMEHAEACEFLDNLGIIGLEACRDAEDYGDATYHAYNGTVAFIEYRSEASV